MSRPRVFVCEDNPGMLDRICALLSTKFELAGTARDGKTLVEEVQRHQPDVVILDISMPLMNGIEAARQIRVSGCDAKLIFLSLNEDPALIRACFAEGASGYVIKYQLEPDLMTAVNGALSWPSVESPTDLDRLRR